ncbi:MAG: ammonia-forming cytochrome c nitrite reductase [Proteobacteria bacterium]|nr:ammonia-forming cytochrome c nitrite reductase [Pseudomonadota bacterium]
MKTSKKLLRCTLVTIASLTLLSSPIHAGAADQKGDIKNPVVKEKGVEAKNEEWAKHYPRQYNSWKETSKSESLDDMLKKKPQLPVLWAGYGFAKDYNAPRGHFYAIQDNVNTLRTGAPVSPITGPMPTACWTCKSPDVPRLMQEVGEKEYFTGKWAKYGSEVVNPIGCGDCHDSKTGELTLTRDYLKRGLEASGVDVAKLNKDDMRSLVCAQCHSEYYFKKSEETDSKGEKKVAMTVIFPWDNGFKGEDVEAYYDALNFSDWTHAISKAPMLKAQHPDYEVFVGGVHGRRGLSCADCHMPTKKDGDAVFTEHKVGSPLDNIENTCLTCHSESEKEFKDHLAIKLQRKEELMDLAMNGLARAHLEAGKAWEVGATAEEMKDILQDIRHGQWRWDYSIAGHGAFFHNPEEVLRLLAQAGDKAQQARVKLAAVLAKHGVIGYQVPDFSTKEKAQALAGINMEKEVAEKLAFKAALVQEWNKEAVAKGRLNMDSRKGMSDRSSYSK